MITSVALQLAIVLLPGVIWAMIDQQYGAQVRHGIFILALKTVIFGVAAYTFTYLTYAWIGWDFQIPTVSDEGTSVVDREIGDELIASVLYSLGLAIVWLYSVRFKIVSKVLRGIGSTNRFGDEDVWDFVLNANLAAVEFVNVRDFENGLVFAGYIDAFSSSDRLRELVLREAKVYNLDGDELYEMPRIYLSRGMEGMTLEFPFMERTGDNGDG